MKHHSLCTDKECHINCPVAMEGEKQLLEFKKEKVFKCPVSGSIKSCHLKSKYQCPHVGEHFERFATEGKKKGESLCLCVCGNVYKKACIEVTV